MFGCNRPEGYLCLMRKLCAGSTKPAVLWQLPAQVLDATFLTGANSTEAGSSSGGGVGGSAGLEAHWSALVHALSGLSCASLSLLKEPRSVGEGHTRLQDLEAGRTAAPGGG